MKRAAGKLAGKRYPLRMQNAQAWSCTSLLALLQDRVVPLPHHDHLPTSTALPRRPLWPSATRMVRHIGSLDRKLWIVYPTLPAPCEINARQPRTLARNLLSLRLLGKEVCRLLHQRSSDGEQGKAHNTAQHRVVAGSWLA